MSLPKKKASSASPHSYSTLGQQDPDSLNTSEAGKGTHQDQADDSDDDPTNKTSSTLRHRATPRSEDNRDSSAERDDREPFSKRTDRRRRWIRYGIIGGILVILAVLIPLLILKPWMPKYRLAPVWNDAVKALPDDQPLLPIPRNFTFGKDKVLLNRDFKIKVRSDTGDQELPTVPYPILEKAIARCMERLEAKRHASPFSSLATASNNPLETVRILTLSELTIHVKNAQEGLKYGVEESYTIDIAAQGTMAGAKAVLTANTQWGILNGLETFLQLVRIAQPASSTDPTTGGGGTDQTLGNPLEIPNAPWSIQDWPRYSHRGILLDTSRHYIHVKDILRTLDAMSLVKLNVFHWHVLDQQTYPLVSKAYPDLSAKGAERPDFIYTPEDVAAIIKHGEERGIRVLPEFDTPGHAASWGRSYPNITLCLDMEPHAEYGAEPPAGQLDPLAPFTYTLLDGLVKEWAQQFPDAQVHAGGDEINYKCWKTSDRVRDYISNPSRRAEYEKALPPAWESALKENKMSRTKSGKQSGEDKLLEVYLDRAMGMFLAQGKRPIVWEELALEHNVKLPDNAIVQVWKDAENAKRVIAQGRPVILSSSDFWYLDGGQGPWLLGNQGQSPMRSWMWIYSYKLDDELNAEEQKMVYGGEVCMWSELTDSSNLDPKLWPRSAAAAEILWSDHQDEHGQARPLMHVVKRLDAIREQLIQMGVGATPLYPSWCSKHPEGCLN